MKTHFQSLIILLAVASMGLFSCKKENNSCSGGNLCFSLNGQDVSVNAVRKTLPNNHYRLYREEGDSSDTKTIEIDIFGDVVGEYTFSNNAGTLGDAGFQYELLENGNQVSYKAVSGTLKLNSVTDEIWSGTFSATVNDGNNSFSLTDGLFSDVPLE